MGAANESVSSKAEMFKKYKSQMHIEKETTIPSYYKEYNLKTYINKTKKYSLNFIYYDESLKDKGENSDNCTFFEMNTNGNFYGCHYFELFKLVCQKIKGSKKKFILISSGSSAEKIYPYSSNIDELEKYYIYCFNKERYMPLMSKYSKLKGIYNDFDELKNALYSINATENNYIKSSNLITFDEYSKIYIRLHYEFIRKYSLYKILKNKNLNEGEFLNYIKYEFPNFLEIAKQLFPDKNEIIQFFKNNTSEPEYSISKVFNCGDNIQSYIYNYTSEGFYYRYINKFLREGDFNAFRIISSHIAKFIYNLYDFREKKNLFNNDSTLYRKMYISEKELENYQFLEGNVICYPAFTSTSLKENGGYEPTKYIDSDVLVQLIIEPNNNKFSIPILEHSEFPDEDEYLFLPFSFFKIKNVKYGQGNISNPHKVYLKALSSDKTIEEMFIDFMENETDNLIPDGLDMLLLTNQNEKIIFNAEYYRKNLCYN